MHLGDLFNQRYKVTHIVDVYTANLLCEIPDFNQEMENKVLRDARWESQSEPVMRKDGLCPEGGDPWPPRYLYSPQPLQGTQEAPRVDVNKLKIKLIDFGGGEDLPFLRLEIQVP